MDARERKYEYEIYSMWKELRQTMEKKESTKKWVDAALWEALNGFCDHFIHQLVDPRWRNWLARQTVMLKHVIWRLKVRPFPEEFPNLFLLSTTSVLPVEGRGEGTGGALYV